MKIRDLLVQTLASLKRSPGEPRCQLSCPPSSSLGCLHGQPAALQQALVLLVRGAMRASAQARFLVQAERFTDDFTNQDWVEITLQSSAAVPAARYRQVETILQRMGGRLELETAPGDGCCFYRFYVPCSQVLVPFPGSLARLPGWHGNR